uniref:trans-L-3-hydroxyproline dehydratase n=1 Tax=Ciona savignyi TaxID=51511 RepID=H2ZLZ0_CIOSA
EKHCNMIRTIEMHTACHPLRIIESGFPAILGDTILDKMSYIKENLDYIRKLVMQEPRGCSSMFGAWALKPDLPEADAAFLFLNTTGYTTMCGHAIIALGRYCVDNKLVEYKEPETQVNIQCPCGLVKVYVACSGGVSGKARFHSVPSYSYKLGIVLDLPSYGKVTVDVSYGGAFYAVLPLSAVKLSFETSPLNDIIAAAMEVKKMAEDQIPIIHPDGKEASFLYGVLFTEDKGDLEAKTLCLYGKGTADRSPCGSGTTARMALMFAKGQVAVGESKVFRNPITKSKFSAEITERVNSNNEVIVQISGQAFYTGDCNFIKESADNVDDGFLML